jgi:uncharacterized protein Yka (UPF0111/DUF47 family)
MNKNKLLKEEKNNLRFLIGINTALLNNTSVGVTAKEMLKEEIEKLEKELDDLESKYMKGGNMRR